MAFPRPQSAARGLFGRSRFRALALGATLAAGAPSAWALPSCRDLPVEAIASACTERARMKDPAWVEVEHDYGACSETRLPGKRIRRPKREKSTPYRLAIRDGRPHLLQAVTVVGPKNEAEWREIRAALPIVAERARRFFARMGVDYELQWREKSRKNPKPTWPEVRISLQTGLATSSHIRLGQYLREGTLFGPVDPVTGDGGLHAGVARTVLHELLHHLALPDDYVYPDFLPSSCPLFDRQRNLLRPITLPCVDPLVQGPFCDDLMLGGNDLERATLPADHLARLLKPLCPQLCDLQEPHVDRDEARRLLDDFSAGAERDRAAIGYSRERMLRRLEGLTSAILGDAALSGDARARDWLARVKDASQALRLHSEEHVPVGLESDGTARLWNRFVSPIYTEIRLAPPPVREVVRATWPQSSTSSAVPFVSVVR